MIDTLKILEYFTEEDKQKIAELNLDDLDNLKNKVEAWLEKKRGMFTASTFYKLMGYEDAVEIPKGAHTHIIEKVLERETEAFEDKRYKGKAIEHGKKYEVEAILEFMDRTGKEVEFYGTDQKFIQISNYVGCTPDGFIGIDELAETKCPDSTTHYHYLRFLNEKTFKEICTNYYWQIQGQLYITGRKKCYFISYDPRFKNKEKQMLVIEISRNETDIAKLKKRLYYCVKELQDQLKQMSTNN